MSVITIDTPPARKVYTLPDVAVPDDASKTYAYAAKYSFQDRKLKRFSMRIEPK